MSMDYANKNTIGIDMSQCNGAASTCAQFLYSLEQARLFKTDARYILNQITGETRIRNMTSGSNNQATLHERLDFLGMDQKTREILIKLKPVLLQSMDAALTVFYEKIKVTPEVLKFFQIRI